MRKPFDILAEELSQSYIRGNGTPVELSCVFALKSRIGTYRPADPAGDALE